MIIIPILLAIFNFFLLQVNTQNVDTDHIAITLDSTYTGSLNAENSYFFYKIKIPDDIKLNTTDLIIRVKELDAADVGVGDFSDPDIFASKVNDF